MSECPLLIAEFEKKLREQRELKKRDPSVVDKPVPVSVFDLAAKQKALQDKSSKDKPQLEEETFGNHSVGFGMGKVPHKIIGATDLGGELCFLMKWKGSSMADIVPAKVANVRCPQVVIRFYENRVRWNSKRPLQEMLEEDEDEEDEKEILKYTKQENQTPVAWFRTNGGGDGGGDGIGAE